jgi:hypothetical protein
MHSEAGLEDSYADPHKASHGPKNIILRPQREKRVEEVTLRTAD